MRTCRSFVFWILLCGLGFVGVGCTPSSNETGPVSSTNPIATGGATSTRDFTRLPAGMLAVQGEYSQSGSLRSVVPEKMAAGQRGYLIATTERFRRESNVLDAFVARAKARLA